MDKLVETLRRALEQREDVIFAYLFGSRAHGSDHPRADVDVALYLQESREPWPALDFTNLLSAAVHRDDVDVVILNDAPPTLAFEAIKGTLILSRDEGARVDAEARIMSMYHDRLPYLQRSLDAALARVRERGLA